MPAGMPSEIARRLHATGVDVAAETATHHLLVRGNCLALIEKKSLSIGSSGMMTEHGLAFLVWHDSRPVLAAKGVETDASPEQVAELQRFSRDVKSAFDAPDSLE
jgi:hypothetical protein